MSNQPGNLAKDVPIFHIRQLPDRGWVKRAACAGHDPDLWFLDDQTGSYREARAICGTCPVRQACLDWALDTRTNHGMWGGLNPLQRHQLRRTRQLEQASVRLDDVRPSARYL